MLIQLKHILYELESFPCGDWAPIKFILFGLILSDVFILSFEQHKNQIGSHSSGHSFPHRHIPCRSKHGFEKNKGFWWFLLQFRWCLQDNNTIWSTDDIYYFTFKSFYTLLLVSDQTKVVCSVNRTPVPKIWRPESYSIIFKFLKTRMTV